MRKLHEEIQQHIHSNLCGKVNEFIIDCKLHHMDFGEEIFSDESQREKIREARKTRQEPSWDDVIQLLTEVRDEMNECKQPYRRY